MALPKLIVILGTTACGKSGLGVELAKHVGGEIVSADSRQVYRGLDLGTGKVTEEEMDGVPHHLLDVVSPNQSYSVAEFQRDAYAAIDDILARGKVPLLVGGTGLYVRAVAEGYTFQESQPDPVLRAQLERKSAEELYAMFRAQTGRTLSGGEEKNRHRLVRTMEKLLSGDSLTESPRVPRYEVLQLGMTYPRDVLCRRIDERLQKRLDDGMIEEVARLRAEGATDAFLEGLGLEYRYILWYLTGKLSSQDELFDELGRAIKRFAKRQMVWFKKDRDVLWLDTEGAPLSQAIQAADAFLRG
ncbi:tRNA (adenosine(37)-N6)-dimethylallyltransferase MiaA [Pseudoflavonifractor sp. DSM 107456]|uniref:tRNA dimethylallyltransferase n=1 Tax=Pseudoflavonifractor gallinarum TaxID=2779352 RepID=A0ABR9REC4_9FIRM|nr:tRNA (adenosine(37)-N6)-dimethylallyltransferase MiaA [Pseudoflavonifractor gallinarum]MBE5057057.1 tRNA (adenosine(37)-N6)-dimethylallyltransferase MiaA [Pseudoflavonifractor gallinarum]